MTPASGALSYPQFANIIHPIPLPKTRSSSTSVKTCFLSREIKVKIPLNERHRVSRYLNLLYIIMFFFPLCSLYDLISAYNLPEARYQFSRSIVICFPLSTWKSSRECIWTALCGVQSSTAQRSMSTGCSLMTVSRRFCLQFPLLLNCPLVKECLGKRFCYSVIRMPQYSLTLCAMPYSGLGIWVRAKGERIPMHSHRQW